VAEKNQETNSLLSGVDTASTSAGIPDGKLCRFDLALNVSRYLRGRAGEGSWFTGARDEHAQPRAEDPRRLLCSKPARPFLSIFIYIYL
jgi:hypothetical protein